MQEYNDYVFLTKRYLKSYNYLKNAVELMDADVRNLEFEISCDVAAPIAKYSDEPRGGCPELNTVEAAADRHIRVQAKIDVLREDIRATQRLLAKLDGALQGLKLQSRNIMLDHYLNDMPWSEVGDKYHYSPKRASELGRRAIKDMALMLFGIKAQPTRLNFVFAV